MNFEYLNILAMSIIIILQFFRLGLGYETFNFDCLTIIVLAGIIIINTIIDIRNSKHKLKEEQDALYESEVEDE